MHQSARRSMMKPMAMTKRVALVVAGSALVFEVVALAVSAVLDARLVARGYGDQIDSLTDPVMWVFVFVILAPAVVGVVVLHAQPRHPVGWLFLGLSISMLLSGLLDEWFTHAVIVDPPEVGGARAAAVLAAKSFYPWWPLLTLILLLTPTGTYITARWRMVGRVSVIATVVAFLASVTSGRALGEPYEQAGNPWTIPAIAGVTAVVSLTAFLVVAICLVAAGVSLVVRWGRARGFARRQLLWLALAVAPLPAVIPVHVYAVSTDNQALTLISLSLFLVLIPVTAGLSVLRYRLYDVERVVATTLTYSLLSMLLAAVYGFVVWAGSRATVLDTPSPTATATVGALTAATLFSPLRRGLQRRVDRRFNRRTFDAVTVVRSALDDPATDLELEAVLRQALADESVTVAFPGPEGWVDASGAPAASVADEIDVTRHGRLVARIGFDSAHVDEATVVRVGTLAAVELDNSRLRADLRRNLSELASSRTRIVEAQRAERRRIERDLHDGAQQRLLALAFELRSAQMNGEPARMNAALTAGASSAQEAVRELRDLANGLHPDGLTDGGLPAVLGDLAHRSSVPMVVTAHDEDLPIEVAFTAWLVITEAVVNAQKHAAADRIEVRVTTEVDRLRICVSDDGRGGADPDSSGLRGLQDRVAAAGGETWITSGTSGTTIEAVIPCAS